MATALETFKTVDTSTDQPFHWEPLGAPAQPSVAVIGAGVAGIVAAHRLQGRFEVTLFEKAGALGGHTHTVTLESGPDAGTAIDTGFIVFNDRTYPLFTAFLGDLGVERETSDMSFSFYNPATRFCYAGTSLNGLFTNRLNLARPRFLKMLGEISRFSKATRVDLRAGRLSGRTLSDFLRSGNYSSTFIRNYLVPMGAAIWSASDEQVLEYPVEAFVRFFENHGLLSFEDRPNWLTLTHRGQSYVKAFRRRFQGAIATRARIRGVARLHSGAWIRFEDGSQRRFDTVVLACHADQALRLLEDPTPRELELLSAWSYQKNSAFLHTDASLMPPKKRAWASWNLRKESFEEAGSPACVTYHMNRLQNLRTQQEYFVTLNPIHEIRPDTVQKEMVYHHPVYTLASMATQARLSELNGTNRTFFCGSYFGYGFHEDAVRSAEAVAQRIGVVR